MPALPGGSLVRVIGLRLGLQFSGTDDKHVNANGESPDSGIWGGAQSFGAAGLPSGGDSAMLV